MGIRRPGLKDMYYRAQGQQLDRSQYGPVTAVIQCHHGEMRSDVAQVRGNALIPLGRMEFAHELWHANYEITAGCAKCGRKGVLDLPVIRAAIRQPHRTPLKLNVNDVYRRVD